MKNDIEIQKSTTTSKCNTKRKETPYRSAIRSALTGKIYTR